TWFRRPQHVQQPIWAQSPSVELDQPQRTRPPNRQRARSPRTFHPQPAAWAQGDRHPQPGWAQSPTEAEEPPSKRLVVEGVRAKPKVVRAKPKVVRVQSQN